MLTLFKGTSKPADRKIQILKSFPNGSAILAGAGLSSDRALHCLSKSALPRCRCFFFRSFLYFLHRYKQSSSCCFSSDKKAPHQSGTVFWLQTFKHHSTADPVHRTLHQKKTFQKSKVETSWLMTARRFSTSASIALCWELDCRSPPLGWYPAALPPLPSWFLRQWFQCILRISTDFPAILYWKFSIFSSSLIFLPSKLVSSNSVPQIPEKQFLVSWILHPTGRCQFFQNQLTLYKNLWLFLFYPRSFLSISIQISTDALKVIKTECSCCPWISRRREEVIAPVKGFANWYCWCFVPAGFRDIMIRPS